MAETAPSAFVGTWHLVSMSNPEIDAMLVEYGMDMAELVSLFGAIDMTLDASGAATFSSDGVETGGTWVSVDATNATLFNDDGEQLDVTLRGDQLVWEFVDDELGTASMIFDRGASPN
ncbi:MAG: lipocalin family protein [Promicromonosporaceae bacterium]|nr:lipocalin family protein [Promicromonosporaceae bacterium]